MALQTIAIAVSCLSLVVAGLTGWLTLLRRGSLKMTQPTMVFFGSDSPGGPKKVVLRTLLYSTARRGHIIENMFVVLRRGKTIQNFSYWAYGDKSWVRGSGLRVGYEGVAYYHHFLLHDDVAKWEFVGGDYVVEVFACMVNVSEPSLLACLCLTVTNEAGEALIDRDAGIFFDWEPDSKQYHSRVDIHPAIGQTLAM